LCELSQRGTFISTVMVTTVDHYRSKELTFILATSKSFIGGVQQPKVAGVITHQ